MTHADIRALAIQTFGEEEKADAWLRRPLAELDNLAPHEVAVTEQGRVLIKNILGKIAWGAAA